MKNNSKNIKVKFKDGSQMNVQEFIQKQYKSKITNHFTTENLIMINYALNAMGDSQKNDNFKKALWDTMDKIDMIARFKGLNTNTDTIDFGKQKIFNKLFD
tara:strand:- start:249 stop:551 length:303 start_codon:yes stop_codon:yes gene_type:complete